MTPSPERLTILLPCFNEGQRIAHTLALLDLWFEGRAHVLVVDDGSVDDTLDRANAYAAAHENVSVHHLETNHGKGRAIRAAASLVRSDYVILTDADLAYDRESVAGALAALADAPIAIGNRRHTSSRYDVPVRLFGFLYRRHVVGLVFNALVRALLPLEERDTQCGLKGFHRDVFQRISAALTTDGFALDVEMLVVAHALGLRVVEVPVCVTYQSAKSSVKLLKSAVAMSLDILRIAARRASGLYLRDR